MAFKNGNLSGEGAQTVRSIVSAILRGGDYGDELSAVIDLHLRGDSQSGPFQKTFLRVTRLNMSLGLSKALLTALSAEADQKTLTATLSRSLKKLDLALALNNMPLATAITERLLDRFDRMTGAKHYDGRYMTLEKGAEAKLAEADWAGLKHEVIKASAYFGRDPIAKSLSVGEMLNLGQRGQDQLLDLYVSVMGEIDINLDAMKFTKAAARMDIEDAAELHRLDLQFAEELGITLGRIFKANELDDKKSIKAVLIYPLIIATLNNRRKTDPGLSDALIKKVVEIEPDLKLRSMIEEMDHPVSPSQKEKN